ncbi:unnamed protein product [Clonostachys rosea f. rosea IK726]|uniref:Suppressor of anucleate metulae protein B n=2 Tax=Bionectria ochroleuca TaxID=29856 RepID=A0A0B7K2Y2_BIOOC|nr:unnamed protein product [Clonostachys rosea f. rosea IK726]
MAWVSNCALPEHWSELNAARKQRQQCAQDIERIKIACASGCGKTHVSECSACYKKILDRMLARYSNEAGGEWFSQRSAFVLELEDQFAQAKERKLALKEIESNIESEKEAWYRWVLRRHPEFLAVTDCGVELDELRAVLDDPDRSKDELVKMVWQAVGKPEDWSPKVDEFANKVASVGEDQAALRKLYVDEFLKDRVTGAPVKGAEKYIEMYLEKPDMRLEEIIDSIISENKTSQRFQEQREIHQGRLEELRRAKTAFEQDNPAAVSKGQQRKSAPANANEKPVDLPPCSVCQKEVDPKDVLSCSVCQAVNLLGGEKTLTTYCTETCFHEGYEHHIESEHDCTSGDQCVQEGDEDEEMKDDINGTVICLRCLDEKKMSLFCSSRCAYQNLPSHLDAQHGFKGVTPQEIQNLVKHVEQVVEETLRKQNPGLEFSWTS